MGNLDSLRDWGMRDYVEMQWHMLQQETPEDFVATGRKNQYGALLKSQQVSRLGRDKMGRVRIGGNWSATTQANSSENRSAISDPQK